MEPIFLLRFAIVGKVENAADQLVILPGGLDYRVDRPEGVGRFQFLPLLDADGLPVKPVDVFLRDPEQPVIAVSVV